MEKKRITITGSFFTKEDSRRFEEQFGENPPLLDDALKLPCKICGERYGSHSGFRCPMTFEANHWKYVAWINKKLKGCNLSEDYDAG